VAGAVARGASPRFPVRPVCADRAGNPWSGRR
jgi:hypothetical protein